MQAAGCSKRVSLLRIGLVVSLGLAKAVSAQFATPQMAQPYIPGEQVNLFSSWDGPDKADSFFLELPEGWEVDSVLAVRHRYQHVPFSVNPAGAYGYHVVSTGFLRGEYDVIVRAKAAEFPASFHQAHWSIVPASFVETSSGGAYVPMEASRIRRQLKATPLDLSSFVLALDGTQAPVLLDQQSTERLSGSHTLEFWLRTTALNSIIISGWDGQEDHHYELELVIDGSGAIRYYRNVSGEHVSMGSTVPVADGVWHHVAVSRDVETAWTRLFVDGAVTDSLFDPAVGHLHGRPALAVGSRVIPGARPYVGDIDEIRLWSRVKTATEIQYGMWQKIPAQTSHVSVLSFDSEPGRGSFLQSTPSLERRRGAPQLSVQARDFRAVLGDGRIYLSWSSEHPLTREFTVERSENGQTFESVGKLQVTPQSNLYTFTDENAPDNVVYYRLRQRFDNGGEHIAGSLKVGFGAAESKDEVMLLGNHPNPFNSRTTISYEVLTDQHVEISILDLSGHLISLLVDRQHKPGRHDVSFDGTDYTSGIYFVRLKTSAGQVQTHQIMLTK